MYKTYDKKLKDIKQRLNITSDTTPQIVIISLNDKDNGNKWQISETYYKPKQTSRVNTIYVNDYQDYLDKLGGTATIIIDDLGLCK